MEVKRTWRAQNRDITLRNFETKNVSKLQAESRQHFTTLETTLKSILEVLQSFFEDANCLWNLDEREISAEFRIKAKVYSSPSSPHSGFETQKGTSKSRHLTAVTAVSARGQRCPPFSLLAEKT